MSRAVDIQRRMTRNFRRLARTFEAYSDQIRLAHDALIRADRREWEFPEHVLSEEEREAIYARQMSRTLADIDELPGAG